MEKTGNLKTIALIDADGILYAAALGGQVNCDGKPLVLTTLEHVYKDALERIETQVGWAKADDAFIILSDRTNFRTDILASYKGQRKASPRPILLDGLRAKMAEEAPFKVMLIKGLEADDVCGIAAGQLQRAGRRTVIVSPDKDLLQIPGEVLTVGKKQRALLTVTAETGDRWHMMQTLTGDTTDNYKGCPGWGPAKAERLIAQMELEEMPAWARWAEIVKCFEDAGLTEADCLVQAQVSRICRYEDWDHTAKEVILFQFPAKPALEPELRKAA